MIEQPTCRRCGKPLAAARKGERFSRRCVNIHCKTIWQDLDPDELEPTWRGL